MQKCNSLIVLAVIMGTLFSCKTGDDRLSNANVDSLFLGISLGMEKQAFFDHCWRLNQQKLLTHGPTNQQVEYRLGDAVDDTLTMRFYPNFHEDKIFEMPVTFTYEAWAPWNREYWADSLLVEMVPVFERWYGPGFKKLEHPTQGTVYYKIDGRRRINIFRRDDQFVQAVFTDLKVERKLKEEYAKRLEAEAGQAQ